MEVPKKELCAGILAVDTGKGDYYEDLSDLEKVRFTMVWARKDTCLVFVIYMTKMQPYIKAWEKKTDF